MTKILILSPPLKLSGGVSNYTKLLIQGLDRDKFQIKHLSVGRTGVSKKDIFYPLLILIQLIKLKKILKKFRPDIVHLNPSLKYTAIIRDFLFLKIIKKESCPVLFFIHGWQKEISNIFENILCKNYFKKRFEKANAIVVLANQFKDKLLALGVSPNKIYVSSTMVELEDYIPKNKKFSSPYTVLFCSSIKKTKGPYELLIAIPLVLKKYHDTSFIFVGDGNGLEKLKRKTKKMSIEKNVIFTGYKTGNEKIEFFKKAHIFAFPSYSEGFPTVILEAISAGAVPIYTQVGGLIDTFTDGLNGYKLKSIPPSPNEIAEKIITLIDNPEIMIKMSENNIKEAKQKYDTKILIKKIENIYKILTNNNKNTGI